MKILLKYNQENIEYFDAIAAMATTGHFVKAVQQPLYLECSQNQYDILVVHKSDDINDEIFKLTQKFKIRLVVLDGPNVYISNGQNFTFPRFANTLKYKPQLPDESLETKLYIHCTDAETAEFAQSVRGWKIKVSSVGLLHCANFVGIVNPDNIMKLAKSANVTVTNDQVIRDTLLYNGILALSVKNSMYGLHGANSTNLSEEEYISEQQKLIIPINTLLTILNEKFSYTG